MEKFRKSFLSITGGAVQLLISRMGKEFMSYLISGISSDDIIISITMIEKITYIESDQFSPYRNLAVEEYLLLHCEDKECILYLWQNQNTVVIGRNQNAWKECRTTKLEEEGGHLARRLSGGGAVYHDLGNMNFTFLINKEEYDLDRQLQVIIGAMEILGLKAEKSGRNDILIDGKKFSGNAFYEQEKHCYHHGTIMVGVNMETLSRYLTVSKDKLKSKGVDSVKSRVTNLRDYLPELTMEELKVALKQSFEKVYGLKVRDKKIEDLDTGVIAEREKFFSSWNWLYGRKIDFQYELSHRFGWGGITLQFAVESGKIKDAIAWSDALNPDFIHTLPKYLKGLKYRKESICTELGLFWSDDPQEEGMMKDIIEWIRSEEL